MRKLFVLMIIGFAFLHAIQSSAMEKEKAKDSVVINSEKGKLSDFRAMPKFRIGVNGGFSSPYNGVDLASFVGSSAVGSVEYSLTKQSYLFSKFIYSGYEALEGELADKVYGNNPQPSGIEVITESKTPCRVFSYALGYGLRSNPDLTKFAWRIGLGAIYNRNIQDEFKLKSAEETKILPESRTSSLGLDLMFGFEVPISVDNFGFFSTFNISSGIIGTKSTLGVQYTSMGLIGIYYRL